MNDNKMNINSLLEEFVSSNLSPTESERKEVSAKYDELSSILKFHIRLLWTIYIHHSFA